MPPYKGLLLASSLALLSAQAKAAPPEFFLEGSHVSDPTQRAGDIEVDYLGMGFTWAFGKRKAFELDLSLGGRALNCSLTSNARTCPFDYGGKVAVRWL